MSKYQIKPTRFSAERLGGITFSMKLQLSFDTFSPTKTVNSIFSKNLFFCTFPLCTKWLGLGPQIPSGLFSLVSFGSLMCFNYFFMSCSVTHVASSSSSSSPSSASSASPIRGGGNSRYPRDERCPTSCSLNFFQGPP